MNKIVKKTLIISGIVVGALVGLFLLLYLVLALIGCAMYGEARNLRKYVCTIPEINSGFAPQGVTYSKDENCYILTGYDNADTTLLYIVTDKNYKRVKLTDKDDNIIKGHAGGVTCTKNRVYVSQNSCLYMFDLSELVQASDGAVSVKEIFPVDTGKTITPEYEHAPDAQKISVPLYYLDSTTEFKTLTLPAFGEDITIVDDRVIVNNEASANRYIVGKFFGANKVYSYPLYSKDDE